MSLIAETSNPLLAQALLATLQSRPHGGGRLGELEAIALRAGLVQNTPKPRFHEPQLVLFAADHGLAVEGLPVPPAGRTDEQVAGVLGGRHPVAAFARQAGLGLTVIDCGMANPLPAQDGLLQRKIAHGTRNCRLGAAMSVEQAQAAIRAGMEIGDALRGNAVACAGLGLGSAEAAALVLSRLTSTPVQDLLSAEDPRADAATVAAQQAHLMLLAQAAQGRHREVIDPVEVLAAFGGFETAVMVGVMLLAASKRHLLLVDGLAACAALWVAARIAEPVTDYVVFCRSSPHPGLTRALTLLQGRPLLDIGLDALDGTGACLSWPLVRSAAAALTDMADGPAAGDTAPMGLVHGG